MHKVPDCLYLSRCSSGSGYSQPHIWNNSNSQLNMSSNNIIRLTGAGSAVRQFTNTATASGTTDAFTVNVDEVRRVLGGVAKKPASVVQVPPATAGASKEKTASKRKSASDKKKKDKEGGQKPKKSK